MKRFSGGLAALTVGAVAVLPAAAPAVATPRPTAKAALTGVAVCDGTDWKATFTFTNTSTTRTALITDVDGVLDPALPLVVAPGAAVTDTATLPSSRPFAWVTVRFSWQAAVPSSSVTPVPPAPPVPSSSVPAPDVSVVSPPPADTTAQAFTLNDSSRTPSITLFRKVLRPVCTSPSAPVSPSTTATVSPTATTSVSPSVPVPSEPTPTFPPSATATASPTPEQTVAPEDEESTSPTATLPPVRNVSGDGGGLPLTGAPAAFTAAGGLALIAAGVGAVLYVRRRRNTFSA